MYSAQITLSSLCSEYLKSLTSIPGLLFS
jgi:hypothetical protein